MPAGVALSLNRDCSLAERSLGATTVTGPLGLATLRELSGGMRAALRRLAVGGASEEALLELVREADGQRQVLPFVICLERLARAGLLAYTLRADDGPLLSLLPITPGLRVAPAPIDASAYVLSRFAY